MSDSLRHIWTIAKRELSGYFASPVAYVVIVIFLLLIGFFTFMLGGFFNVGEASLSNTFFRWHPWLYLFLVPSVGMRLWAEERRQGTMELLLTMPITAWQAIVGKFLASWLFLIIALALTFPIVITVSYLGHPDLGAIFTGYLGSALLAGAYLAVTCFRSEERRLHTLELLLTMPITPWQAIVGKFIASWLFLIIALVLTFPVVITVCYLGNADLGEIFTGYVGSALMAGGYLAVTSMTSAFTRNQVISFIVSVVVCFFLLLAGFEPVTNLLPDSLVGIVTSLSSLTHFIAFQKGVIDSQDVIYFGTLIGFALFLNGVIIRNLRAG